MNKQEYEEKKYECWLDTANFCGFSTHDDIKHSAFDTAFDRAYELGKQEKDGIDLKKLDQMLDDALEKETKESLNQWLSEKDAGIVIQGWVARDANNSLYLYEKRPVRDHDEWIEETVICLDDDLLPDVTWESDPEPVEIIIKRKKKEEMSYYDNHKPGDAIWMLLLFFMAMSVIAAIGLYLTA